MGVLRVVLLQVLAAAWVASLRTSLRCCRVVSDVTIVIAAN